MTLPCPRCGARRFYAERGNGYVFFHVNAEGRLVDVTPVGVDATTAANGEIACASCSWSGTVEALLSSVNRDSEPTGER